MHVPGVIASYCADDCSHDYRYFRQLQEISDTVVEPTWEGHVAAAVSGKQDQLRELEGKINTEKARLRYLDNLVRVRRDINFVRHSHRSCVCSLRVPPMSPFASSILNNMRCCTILYELNAYQIGRTYATFATIRQFDKQMLKLEVFRNSVLSNVVHGRGRCFFSGFKNRV